MTTTTWLEEVVSNFAKRSFQDDVLARMGQTCGTPPVSYSDRSKGRDTETHTEKRRWGICH